MEKLNGYLSFALRNFGQSESREGAWAAAAWHARLSCARMDVKPINRRGRSVERVHAPRLKAGIDLRGRGKHGEAEQTSCHGQRKQLDEL